MKERVGWQPVLQVSKTSIDEQDHTCVISHQPRMHAGEQLICGFVVASSRCALQQARQVLGVGFGEHRGRLHPRPLELRHRIQPVLTYHDSIGCGVRHFFYFPSDNFIPSQVDFSHGRSLALF